MVSASGGSSVLPARTLERLTDASLALHGARTLDALCANAIDAISQLVPCDIPVVSLATSLLPSTRFSYSPHPAEWNAVADRALARAHEDPVYTGRLRLLLDSAASVTTMISRADLVRTAYHDEVWRPFGLQRMLRCVSPGTMGLSIDVSRTTDREFTDLESALVQVLARHLDAAASALAKRHRDRLPNGQSFHPVQTFAWLVCDRSGRVLRSEPAARDRMRAALGPRAPLDRLPAAWCREIENRSLGKPSTIFWHAFEGRPMSVHVAPIRPTPGEFSVGFLTHPGADDPAAPLRRLGLTPRQVEVLHWVMQGKTNPEIGIILGISPLTAKKHLEAIFDVLGVENRTAAVAIALEAQRSD